MFLEISLKKEKYKKRNKIIKYQQHIRIFI